MMNRRLLLMMLVLGLTVQGATAAMADSEREHEKEDSSGGGGTAGTGSSREGDDNEKNESTDSSKDDDGGSNEREGGGGNQRGRSDNDAWIRREVSAGKVAPLRKILATVREQYGGQVVRVRLTGRGANRMYRIRLIDTSNQLIEVQVNASTGNIVVPSGIY